MFNLCRDVQECSLPSWKVEPKYSTKVLVGNWGEERRRVRMGGGGTGIPGFPKGEPGLWAISACSSDGCLSGSFQFVRENEGTGLSTFKQDFVPFPTGAPDRTVMRRLMKRLEGLPRKYILTHCEEPRHQHLVSQYEDQYNRHGHNPHLPPLRKWDRHKLAWTPEKSDYPLVEPPTSYGLLEHLMETWHRKEPGVGESTYHSSYPKPPASAYAPRQRPDARRILQQSRKQWLPRSLDAPA
ncbi:uncharacterized protein C1orf158 homolog isoform X1 [Thamnophis elegans]|uniref:uncharacterized protein C1orf158 homolog isoform X1 n=1 Tax=Thamnophis elegans TaxID=35005 RepID=UPI001378D5BA|nr:uncharacterized protein C1orf158 homolog isoform X1 [Thamnophis elegans]